MRLGESVVADELRLVAGRLAGGRLDFYEGAQLIVSVPFSSSVAPVSSGEVSFGGFSPAVATGSGTVDSFRAMDGDQLVFEGSAGPDGELQFEPTYTIESGDVVRIFGLTYVQPL